VTKPISDDDMVELDAFVREAFHSSTWVHKRYNSLRERLRQAEQRLSLAELVVEATEELDSFYDNHGQSVKREREIIAAQKKALAAYRGATGGKSSE
jgi:hypothetical protein